MNINDIKTAFDRLLEKARVKEEENGSPNQAEHLQQESPEDDRSVGQRLYDEMLAHFEKVVKTHSVGKSMVFHMGYVIWIHPSDYQKIHEELVVIIPEIVDGFYEIIRQKMENKIYQKCPVPSSAWLFQITPTDIVPKDNTGEALSEYINLKEGEFRISSTFHSLNQSNVREQPNVVLSFRSPNNSNVMKDVNVNKELLLGMEAMRGAISIPFSYVKSGLKPDAETIHNMQGYATLKYSTGAVNLTYTVQDKSFFVSGSEDQRKQSSVWVLPEKQIIIGHLNFRYREADDQFEVLAYGPTVMNERVLPLSTVDDPKPYPVSAKAKFLLNGSVGIEFSQIKLQS